LFIDNHVDVTVLPPSTDH